MKNRQKRLKLKNNEILAKTVAALEPALAVLIAHEYLRRPEALRAGPGRPRSPTYEVNPYAHNTQNPQNGYAPGLEGTP